MQFAANQIFEEPPFDAATKSVHTLKGDSKITPRDAPANASTTGNEITQVTYQSNDTTPYIGRRNQIMSDA